MQAERGFRSYHQWTLAVKLESEYLIRFEGGRALAAENDFPRNAEDKVAGEGDTRKLNDES